MAWISISAEAKERIRLPVYFAGCGLKELEDCRYAEYLGSMLQDDSMYQQLSISLVRHPLAPMNHGTSSSHTQTAPSPMTYNLAGPDYNPNTSKQ
eukprot:12732817-Ditylum_brightwellii.AAC.1